MAAVSTKEPSFIAPERMYSRRGFISATGLSETRLREARQHGLECRRIWVGKRSFYRGADIITFIELLARTEIQRSLNSEIDPE